jgi:hypothetical protein
MFSWSITSRKSFYCAIFTFIFFSFLLTGCGGSSDGDSGSNDTSIDGVITPNESEVVTDEDGNEIAVNLVLAAMKEAYSDIEYAQALADTEEGQVVGHIPNLSIFQIRLNTSSLSELQDAVDRLSQNAYADSVLPEIKVLSPFASWDGEEEHWNNDIQFESNRVEEGTELFNATFSNPNIEHGLVKIGVIEPDGRVDFDVDDFADFKGGQSYNNITINADDGVNHLNEKSHASLVTGVLAAKVGNGGMGGLLSSFEIERGGFDIQVKGDTWYGTLIDYTNDLIDDGVELINMSYGGYLKGTLNYDGDDIVSINSDAPVSPRWIFEGYKFFYSRLFSKNPNVIFIIAAGNHKVQINEHNQYLSGVGHLYNNVIVVGGHTGDGGDTAVWHNNAWGSTDFGDNVDITAASEVGAYEHCCDDDGDGLKNYAEGTSFSAPFVTATIAAMKSINPSLTPSELIGLLRKSALPIEHCDSSHNITRPLTEEEVGNGSSRIGKGARLNVEGAIQSVICSLPEGCSDDGNDTDDDSDGYTENEGDCNDNNADIYPGAPELCDGVDNQCTGDDGYGTVDEGCQTCTDGTHNIFY